ncbi:MAG: inorganic diphosphatase [Xanthobacteraceae bacterium]
MKLLIASCDLPEILIEQIGHFFEHYKDLKKGKWVKLARWVDRGGAEAFIRSGIARAAAGTAGSKSEPRLPRHQGRARAVRGRNGARRQALKTRKESKACARRA